MYAINCRKYIVFMFGNTVENKKSTRRGYFSEGNSVSFPERYLKSEEGWDFNILRMRSPEEWGDLYKCVAALRRTDPLSCLS